MKFYELSKEKADELLQTELSSLSLPGRIIHSLSLGGFQTLGDLIYTTREELQDLYDMGSKHLKILLAELSKQDISIPTEKEKKKIMDSLDTEQKIELFTTKKRILQKRISRQEASYQAIREIQDAIEEKKRNDQNRQYNAVFVEAEKVLATAENPIASLVKNMVYGEYNFCTLLELWDKNDDCPMGNIEDRDPDSIKKYWNACEECIEKYLSDYFYSGRHLTETANGTETPAKITRVWGFDSDSRGGDCPKCYRAIHYKDKENFCSRCGHPLIWDEKMFEEWLKRRKEWDEAEEADDVEDSEYLFDWNDPEDRKELEEMIYINHLSEDMGIMKTKLEQLQELKELWDNFMLVPVDSATGQIAESWNNHPAGTPSQEILDWFRAQVCSGHIVLFQEQEKLF